MSNPAEPNAVELRSRIRRWLRYFWLESGLQQKEIAEAMGFSKATISDLLSEKTTPGLDCLVRMHYRLGADLRRVVREDPPAVDVRPGIGKARK